MFRYAEQANWLAWNNEHTKALQLLEPYVDENPICAAELCQAYCLTNGIRSVKEIGDVLEYIVRAEETLSRVEKSNTSILEFAKKTILLNKNAVESPTEGYSFPQHPASDVSLESLTDDQLLHNFKMVCKMVSGELHLMRGIAQAMTGSYLKAVYNIRSGYGIYRDLYKSIDLNNNDISSPKYVHPDLVDCIRAIYGACQYLISEAPPSTHWLMSMFGLEANRKEGLYNLRQVVTHESRMSPFATIILLVHHVFITSGMKSRESKLEAFKPLMERTLERYPQSTCLLFLSSHYVRKTGFSEGALKNATTAFDSAQAKLGITPYFVVSELAQLELLNGEYEKACKLLESAIIEQNEEFGGKSYSAFLLAMIYGLLGRDEDRDKVLGRVDEFISKRNTSLEAYVKVKKEVIKKVQGHELNIMLLMTYYELMYARDRLNELKPDSRALAMKLQKLEELKEKTKFTFYDLEIAVQFFEATLKRRTNRDSEEESIQKLKQIASYLPQLKVEKQWAAYANLELAEILFNKTEKEEEIEIYLKAAQSIKKISTEDMFQPKVKKSLAQLHKRQMKNKQA
jgi:hypothetical protein